MRRSATWRDRPIEVAEESFSPSQPRRQRPMGSVAPVDGRAPTGMVHNAAAESRRAAIPQAVSATYTVAPRSGLSSRGAPGVGSAGASGAAASLDRFKSFSSKLKSSRKKAGR
jgi:hypothetical protein